MKIFHVLVIAFVSLFSTTVYSQGLASTSAEIPAHKVPDINSKADDYGSCISANGLTIYFASNRFGKFHIYFSKRKTTDTPWSEPDYCKVTGNPQDYVGAISLDEIGRFYFATNREVGAHGNINIWEGFGLDSIPTIRSLPEPVNTSKWESQPWATYDGNDLYFASNRQSPAGSIEMQTDIFVSHRNQGDKWTEPENLGPMVNFGVYNSTPFITPDGRFLFFSSKEKRGVDIKKKIYMSEHIGPKTTDWSKAVLLPKGINSEKDDIFPMIAHDGKTIFFSSNRDGGTGFDIYEAKLPDYIQSRIAASYKAK